VGTGRMYTTIRNQITGRISEAEARVLCYVLGPVSGALMIHLGRYGDVWSVRFHAFHSMLMTIVWVLTWGILRLVEEILPWFPATVTRQFRLAVNLGFIAVWVILMAAAYGGSRCVIVPFVHRIAVRLARRSGRIGHR